MYLVMPLDRRFEVGAHEARRQCHGGDDADEDAQPHQAIGVDRRLGTGRDSRCGGSDRLDVGTGTMPGKT